LLIDRWWRPALAVPFVNFIHKILGFAPTYLFTSVYLFVNKGMEK
jgi:hypothetical protein